MVRREEISLIHEYLIETASWHLGRDSWGHLVLVMLHSLMQSRSLESLLELQTIHRFLQSRRKPLLGPQCLNVKALVFGAFNQEKALVGAFFVIAKTNGSFAALVSPDSSR